MTCTITLLRSLADLGGAFDVPTQKCPPDRGSSNCVRDSSAPFHATPHAHASPYPYADNPKPQSQPTNNHHQTSYFPSSPTSHHIPSMPELKSRSAPQPIRKPVEYAHNLATPPLTPDDGSDDAPIRHADEGDALELLTTLFPLDGAKALPYAKRVSISSPDVGQAFDGVVLELPGKPKTLYVDAKSAELVNLRESIVALLDLADEHLECSALVIALDKTSSALGDVLHSLMYVGGTVVTKSPFQVDPAYVLVGLEI